MKICNVLKPDTRRGISQIVGTLFTLAIVTAFGSIILIQGMQGINSFNAFMTGFGANQNDVLQESIIIEHIRFQHNNNNVTIWIRNTGVTDVTISTITLVKVDSQELVINKDLTTEEKVFVKDLKQITLDDPDITMPSACSSTWSSCQGTTVRVSVTTTKGNIITATARPYNT